MHRQRVVIGAVVAILVGSAALCVPVFQKNIVTLGVDRYENHRPIFGDREQAQSVVLRRDLYGIAALLVDLKQARDVPDVTVTVSDQATGVLLRTAVIPATAIQDDSFASVHFPEPLRWADRTVRITLAAPSATSTNPIGIRHDNEGTLSVGLIERVPVWQHVVTAVNTYPQRTYQFFGSVVAAVLLTVLACRVGWQHLSRRRQRVLEWAILLILALGAVMTRGMVASELTGVSGGDAYNYLSITQSMTTFDNPFSAGKRLPGYPLVLLPAFLTPIDDIWWMRAVTLTAAGAAIVLIAIVARALGLPWPVQLLTAVLLACQKDFFWTSLRPEPYTFYTAVLLAATALWFRLDRPWRQIGFGLLLGYGAMSRQEGFIGAAVLSLLSLCFWRQVFLGQPLSWRHWATELWPARGEWRGLIWAYLRSFLPALALVLPFFISNFVLYGNPLYTPYFAGDRLQIVTSWPAFLDSLGATWGVVGPHWWPVWDRSARVGLYHPLLIAAVMGTVLWWTAGRASRQPRWRAATWVFPVTALCIVVASSFLFLTAPSVFTQTIQVVSAGVLLASIAIFATASWQTASLTLLAGTQALVALWFHPFAKHFQQVIPFMSLALATVVYAARPALPQYPRTIAASYRIASQTVAAALPAFLAVALLISSLEVTIAAFNRKTAGDHVIYESVTAARVLPGPYGFDQAYQVAQLYFGGDATYYSARQYSPRAEHDWLAHHAIDTLVVTSISGHFREVSAEWRPVFQIAVPDRNDQPVHGTVYQRYPQE